MYRFCDSTQTFAYETNPFHHEERACLLFWLAHGVDFRGRVSFGGALLLFLGRYLLRPQHCRCPAPVPQPALADDFPGSGADHAAVERGGADRHAGSAAHPAGERLAVGARQIPGSDDTDQRRPGPDSVPPHHRRFSRRPGLGTGGGRLPGRPAPGRRLHRHRPVRFLPHREPPGCPHPHGPGLRLLLSGGVNHRGRFLWQHGGEYPAGGGVRQPLREHPTRGHRYPRPGLLSVHHCVLPRAQCGVARQQALEPGREYVAVSAQHGPLRRSGRPQPDRFERLAESTQRAARRPHGGTRLQPVAADGGHPGAGAGALADPQRTSARRPIRCWRLWLRPSPTCCASTRLPVGAKSLPRS